MVGGLEYLGELSSLVLSGSQALFGTFAICAHVPFFRISYYSITIILGSVSSSSFTLTFSMREVSCVGYTLRALDPSPLQSMLNRPSSFGLLQRLHSD